MAILAQESCSGRFEIQRSSHDSLHPSQLSIILIYSIPLGAHRNPPFMADFLIGDYPTAHITRQRGVQRNLAEVQPCGEPQQAGRNASSAGRVHAIGAFLNTPRSCFCI
jgi:hypothetical protein